jgi:hypothetical protein
MDNILNRVITQFDTLIPFLAISHEDVFSLINKEKNIWFAPEQRAALPVSYKIYKTQITHSAFLLGYSFFEAFLTDLVRQIYVSMPKMLPKEKQIKYSEILECKNYKTVLEIMIEREIIDLFYKRVDEVIRYFEDKLNLKWPDKYKNDIVFASCLRNCIIHNLGRANDRLSQVSKYKTGDRFELSSSEVHEFGIKARDLVRNLFHQAENRYFKKTRKKLNTKATKKFGKRKS